MMSDYNWYRTIQKPNWAPPSWLFGPVWTVLYLLIALSYGYVGFLVFTKVLPLALLLPFALNLFFNLIFAPLQFGLKNNYLSAFDILLVLGTLIWEILAIYPYAPWVSFINLPYLAWVSFATVLQLTITVINR